LPGTLPRFLGYEHFAYTPYGESWVAEDLNQQTTTMTHRFTGQELDQETGLYAFPARYYDPQTSRWMGADPAMGEYLPVAPTSEDARKHNQQLPGMGGVFNYVNLQPYHYGANNPLAYSDPTGRNNELAQELSADDFGGGGRPAETIRTNAVFGIDVAFLLAIGFEVGRYEESGGESGTYLTLSGGTGLEAGIKIPLLSRLGDVAGGALERIAGRIAGEAAEEIVNAGLGTALSTAGRALLERNVSEGSADSLRGWGQVNRVHVLAGVTQDGETYDTQFTISPTVGGAAVWTYTFIWRDRN